MGHLTLNRKKIPSISFDIVGPGAIIVDATKTGTFGCGAFTKFIDGVFLGQTSAYCNIDTPTQPFTISIPIPSGQHTFKLGHEDCFFGDNFGEREADIYYFQSLNQPPEAICQDVTVTTEPGICISEASVDDGSYDPDGDPITLVQEPPGPYCLGTTEVILTVTDDKGLSDQCSATVAAVYKEISVDINIHPKVLNLKSKGKRIISGIRLPKEYDPHDIARDSLELSIPTCSGCEVIFPACGFPLWKRYLAFFPRQDLIDEIETMNLELPTKLDLKITGELDNGAQFEGLDTIQVVKQKKWTKRK